MGFAPRGERTRTRQYVEHPEARKHRRVRCIVGRHLHPLGVCGVDHQGRLHSADQALVEGVDVGDLVALRGLQAGDECKIRSMPS